MNTVTIWLLCGVIGVGLELVLPGFIIIFFGCGAILTGIADWIFPTLPIEAQLVIFLSCSILLLILFRKMLKNKFFNKINESGDELADEYIGKLATALTDFQHGQGEVEFKGSKWDAISTEEIQKGDIVIITNRESIKLVVTPAN